MEWIIGSMIVGGIGALFKGIGKDAKMKEENRKIERARNNLSESYNMATRQEQETYDFEKNQMQQAISTVRENQARGVTQNSGNIALQDEIQSSQIATLQVEASQAEGAAIQNMATSGFRAVGSALNNVVEVARKGRDAIERAFLQRSLSNQQSYQSALNAYIGADQQVIQYQSEIESMDIAHRQNQESMALDFRQRDEELLAGKYTDMDFTFNWISTGLGVAGSLLDSYADNKEYFGNK